MRKFLAFVGEHFLRILATIGLVALMIHWGIFGFAILSVPTFALWENLLP